MPGEYLSDKLFWHDSIGVEDDRRRERKGDSTGNENGSGTCRHTLVRRKLGWVQVEIGSNSFANIQHNPFLMNSKSKLPDDALFEPSIKEGQKTSVGLPRCAFSGLRQAFRSPCNWA